MKKLELRVIKLVDSGDYEVEFNARKIATNLIIYLHLSKSGSNQLWQRLETMITWAVKADYEKVAGEHGQVVIGKTELMRIMPALR